MSTKWVDRDNLVIQSSILPADRYANPWPSYLEWAKLCDKAIAGEIPSKTRYIVQFVGNGIWSIAGYADSMESAIKIAEGLDPAPYTKLPVGHMVTSTGDVVHADDWDDAEQ